MGHGVIWKRTGLLVVLSAVAILVLIMVAGPMIWAARAIRRILNLKGGNNVLSLILLVFAFVLAVIAGLRPPNNPPFDVLGWRLLCFALACFFLANLLGNPAALKLIG